jgi:hypothetical protein
MPLRRVVGCLVNAHREARMRRHEAPDLTRQDLPFLPHRAPGDRQHRRFIAAAAREEETNRGGDQGAHAQMVVERTIRLAHCCANPAVRIDR